MSEKFEVSFNSPQCGWMSVGFSAGGQEFHTTTAAAPHETALSELLKILTDALGEADFERTLKWNRNPEAFDFVFRKFDKNLSIEIVEYPTEEREISETVFQHVGDANDICQAFLKTFEQLYSERRDDEFEQNWRQPFPLTEFEEFRNKLY
jgi:hypothetical protein